MPGHKDADDDAWHALHRASATLISTFVFIGVHSVRRFEEVSMAQQTPSAIVRHASTWSMLCGVLLIVFGMLAVGSPAVAAVAVNAVIAWLIVLAGVVHLVLAFHAHGAGSLLWKLV